MHYGASSTVDIVSNGGSKVLPSQAIRREDFWRPKSASLAPHNTLAVAAAFSSWSLDCRQMSASRQLGELSREDHHGAEHMLGDLGVAADSLRVPKVLPQGL